ncbi:hypothetical protein ACROYT_G013010 [Oculina patagonica]
MNIVLCLLILPLITLCSATSNSGSGKTNSKTSQSLCYGGKPGTNGIPGMHGMPGPPGAPGRDGREGAKGDQGSSGKTGPQGPPGAEGKKGAKGEPGVQGPAGKKGERGEKGDSGTPGTPQLSSHMNWKECTWKSVDDKDSGFMDAITAVAGGISPSMAPSAAHLGPLLVRSTCGTARTTTFTVTAILKVTVIKFIRERCEWDSGLESALATSLLTQKQVGLQYPGSSLKRCQKLSSNHVTRDPLDFLIEL